MVLLIDNYDSFVYNLARYLRRLGVEVVVLRNDSNLLMQRAAEASAIVLSPGPCGPEQAGDCIRVVQQISGHVPILGICLGHQIVCQAFGGTIVRAQRPIHGMALPIELSPSVLFKGLNKVTNFARYHSLVADSSSLPACLKVIAKSLRQVTDSELQDCELQPHRENTDHKSEIMAVEHQEHLTFGVQFHPESILSTDGYRLLSNFLRLAGFKQEIELPEPDLSPIGNVC